ncbi:MAG: hypothetical protein LCH73_04215 [Proteobacteria bacterium]|nr:hypothetical protein [Pseudomonadota bacterium]
MSSPHARHDSPPPEGAISGPGQPGATEVTASYRESVACFGPQGRLVGILCEPLATPAASVACLLTNTGVGERIGPNRVNVKLARALAGQGVTSLRFDISGLGESPSATTSVGGFRTQVVRDQQAAMDWLTAQRGFARFMQFGICSGAVNGYLLAEAEPRLVGLAMFDGFAYVTGAARLRYQWLDWRRTPLAQWPAKLGDKLHGRVRRATGNVQAAPDMFAGDSVPITPPPAAFAATLNALTARGVEVAIWYSGSGLFEVNHPRQLHEAFAGQPFMAEVTTDLLLDVDHIVTPLSAQRRILALVGDWARRVIARQPKEVS